MMFLDMTLADTTPLMTSEDYKDRFIAEYYQTKIRYEKLKDFNSRIEAAQIMNKEEPKHDCPHFLLRDQQKVMGEYLHFLELRAKIEDVDLGKPFHTCCERSEQKCLKQKA